MKTIVSFKLLLATLTLFGVANLSLNTLFAHSHKAHVAETMANAANAFLASLNEKQKAKATFDFENPTRVAWEFLPAAMINRKGISLLDLNDKQKKLAYEFLKSSLSESGNKKLVDIIDLERVLLDLTGSDIRIPELYTIMVFGEPSADATWGWRFEGHHISLNITVVDGEMIATAPRFLGSNPAHVQSGDRKGLRVLGKEEDLARQLMEALNDKQREIALFQSIPYPEIVTNRATEVGPLSPVGLSASRMSKSQKALLERVIDTYASTMPESLANMRMEKLREAGIDKIQFGWAGSLKPGEGHYYRIQGPTFLIEYDNVQNNANHAHTIWRDFNGDFGRDILKEHYLNHPH